VIGGRLITLEGGEGAGKSTAIAAVQEWLEARGRKVVLTREPGGTPAAESIRRLLLDPATGELAPMTELLLMFAARAENLAAVIQPALAQGLDVVCDRFSDASMAYQGAGRKLGSAPVETLKNLVHPDIRPDLTLLLDVPVEVGMARISDREQGPDRFEQTRAGFLERVRQGYLDAARQEPDRFAVINASKPLAKVRAAILRTLEERLS
jgi:dTMP kinase